MAQSLKVIIIGAGIGGLTAAIGLRQQGHEVEVFERSRLANEVGAAMHVAPNFTVVLNRLGIFPEEFSGTPYQGVSLKDSAGKLKYDMSVGEGRKHWKAEYWLVHRVDLHSALKHRATGPDGPGRAVKLHTASAVAHVDCRTATVTLADGSTASGDVVIAADGVHSATRETVAGGGGGAFPTRTSGKCCYRWLMPQSALLGDDADADADADAELRELVGEPGVVTEVAGADRRIVFYPCKDGQLMNCAAFVPVEEVGVIQKGWNQAGQKEKLIQSFSNFGPQVVRMLERAPEGKVAVWDLLDMDVLPTWVNDRAALLGDAAHPFLPYMGQGAAQAIEDAAAIGALLPLGTTPHEIPRRLQLYEKCRKERADFVQEFTRLRGKDGGRGHDEVASVLQRCISHDAWAHAAGVLKADIEEQAGFHPEARI